jgi:hypothetical protein
MCPIFRIWKDIQVVEQKNYVCVVQPFKILEMTGSKDDRSFDLLFGKPYFLNTFFMKLDT